jgi:hypothetical protein
MPRTRAVRLSSAPGNLSSPNDAMLELNARQATDPSTPPRGFADVASAPARAIAPPGHWGKQRRPPRPGDHQLHHDATEWVLQLPMAVRPASTCARYPRIVNRIVEAWLRADQCRHLFEQLLSDRRPARRGFPLSVREELRALAAYRLQGILPVPRD